MANIEAIEKSVMTTTDEKLLKQMAESMPFDIYSRLSPEARSRLVKAYGKEVPASSPYTGVLPMKKAHRKLTEKERDRMIDVIASGPLTYRPAIDDELFKLGLIEWYDRDPKTNAVDYSGKPFYANNGRILPEWYEFKQETSVKVELNLSYLDSTIKGKDIKAISVTYYNKGEGEDWTENVPFRVLEG